MPSIRPAFLVFAALLATALPAAHRARADAVIDANAGAADVASTNRITPFAVRTMAIVQVSVFDAVASITGAATPIVETPRASAGASVDAAVAAATHVALLELVPAERERIEAAYVAALARVPDGAARAAGIEAGERAARAVLAARADDGATAVRPYRPRTTPGVYVPTTAPAVPQWGRRRPWLMRAGDQFRPGPPPALDSETWKHDLAESMALGRRNSPTRTSEQTAMAKFWETTSPSVYWPLVREVAQAKGDDPTAHARLLAVAGMAMDDAVIAVFDAKYAYEFWRPVTAIRSSADSTWEPLIETPMHPEYPCAHCIVSATVGTVLEDVLGATPPPVLRSSSPTAIGSDRTWTSLDAFVDEVSEARICAGVHYRHSTEVAREMGRKIAGLAKSRFPR